MCLKCGIHVACGIGGSELAGIDLREFHMGELAKLDPEYRDRCVSYLRTKIPSEVLCRVYAMYNDDPVNWSVEFHFSAGMAVRNLLRNGGFTDNQLPSGNWDDYYVPILELAAGCWEVVNNG